MALAQWLPRSGVSSVAARFHCSAAAATSAAECGSAIGAAEAMADRRDGGCFFFCGDDAAFCASEAAQDSALRRTLPCAARAAAPADGADESRCVQRRRSCACARARRHDASQRACSMPGGRLFAERCRGRRAALRGGRGRARSLCGRGARRGRGRARGRLQPVAAGRGVRALPRLRQRKVRTRSALPLCACRL
jgi:hypothetical protein